MKPPVEANWRMMEGNKREPWGAELYLRIMGWCGVDVELQTACFASDPSDKRMGGSPDRIVEDKKTGERWLLEIKTCPGGDMRTEIPVTHLLQVSVVHETCENACTLRMRLRLRSASILLALLSTTFHKTRAIAVLQPASSEGWRFPPWQPRAIRLLVFVFCRPHSFFADVGIMPHVRVAQGALHLLEPASRHPY